LAMRSWLKKPLAFYQSRRRFIYRGRWIYERNK